MNKKGAIEFSITTIIIVIVGVTLLALALPWISRTIGQTSDLTDSAFDQARSALAGELGPDNPVVISPNTLRLRPNEETSVSVGCYNGDSGSTSTSATLTITPPNFNGIALPQKSVNPGNVNPGGEAYWGIVIKAISNPTAPDVLNLAIKCSSQLFTRPLTITYE